MSRAPTPMEPWTSSPASDDDAERLRFDHVELERRFAEVCARARSEDPIDLESVWDEFAADVEQHLAFEEARVLPTFAAGGPEKRAIAEQLLEEHEELRRRLAKLGVDLLVHEIRPSAVERFVALLRKHAAREDATTYRWLSRARR